MWPQSSETSSTNSQIYLETEFQTEKLTKMSNKELKNLQTDSIISENNWAMCKKAVGIIGQETEQNYNKIEGQGLEDNSYSIFNLHASSVGTGVGILIILILIFKIIKHSNIQSWMNILRRLFPCCRLTRTSSGTNREIQIITVIIS